MPSPSLYNRWRPRTFAERDDHPLIGQEHVTRTLRNAVAGGQIAHAYLFCGPRGTGKTSAARILARAVNCRRGLRGEPCNECENCQALLSGRQLDLLIEIDGASNRGVDDVRQLRERLMQRPGGADLTGRYKVYIIDEVHMLTTEAFNALLKSLEEPPPHVIFILATTDPQKVPATVASRCQRFDFRPIPVETLARHLAHIAGAEGVQIEPAGLELLARTAAGGARDAVSMLDQALAFAGASPPDGTNAAGVPAAPVLITAQQVQSMLGLTDFDAVCRLVDSVADHDLPAGLRLVHEIATKGSDLRQFTRQVLEFLRAVLLAASDAAELVNLDEETRDAVCQRADRLPLTDLLGIIRLFTQAEQGLRSPSAQPQLPLELAIVEAIVAPPASAPSAVAPPTAPVHATSSPMAARPVPAQVVVPPRAASAPTATKRTASPPRATAVPDADDLPVDWPVSTPEPAPSIPVEETSLPAPAEGTDHLSREQHSTITSEPRPVLAEAPSSSNNEENAAPEPRPSGRDADADVTLEVVRQRWPTVLDSIRHTSKALEAVLKDASPARVEAGDAAPVVVLSFNFPFHAAKAQDGPNLVIVQRALSRVLGIRATVRCEVEGAGTKGDRARSATGPEDPVVTKAMRIMNARVMSPEEVAELQAMQALPVSTLETNDE